MAHLLNYLSLQCDIIYGWPLTWISCTEEPKGLGLFVECLGVMVEQASSGAPSGIHNRNAKGKNGNHEKKFADDHLRNHCSNHFVFLLWKKYFRDNLLSFSQRIIRNSHDQRKLSQSISVLFLNQHCLFLLHLPLSLSQTHTHTSISSNFYCCKASLICQRARKEFWRNLTPTVIMARRHRLHVIPIRITRRKLTLIWPCFY